MESRYMKDEIHSCESGKDSTINRRQMLSRTGTAVGSAALASLLYPGQVLNAVPHSSLGVLPGPHFAPRAKRVIFLFQSGGPSQMELFDHKPKLTDYHGEELPDSIRKSQRVTAMTVSQSSFPCVQSKFRFSRHGKSGIWMSELIPHMASIADEITVVKSVNTEAINHDPAITYINTGSQQLGKASLGSWLSYGIGSECSDLPAYVVLISQGTGRPGGQPLFSRLWSSGFLPSNHQGVKFRSGKDPVLYLSNPPGINRDARRNMLDSLSRINRRKADAFGDPEIETRIAQYEMAYRMQMSVPALTNMSDESDDTFELYGPDARKPGTYAANCLLARRLAERGVRFIQLFHRGWDQHNNLPGQIAGQCQDTDQASAALVKDLKQRGMLEDTLIVWGGEFGRTVYCQGELKNGNYGRDHHGRCFSMWLAGAGIKRGYVHGETDDYCYNIVRDPVHIHNLNATILHALGIDHSKLTFRHQGLDQRLTGVEPVQVVRALFA